MRTFYKVLSALAAIFILATVLSVTSYAKEESATELYERDPDAFYDKYMCVDEEAKEQGLYSDANKSQNKKLVAQAHLPQTKAALAAVGRASYMTAMSFT